MLWLLDLDGVVWLTGRPIPGAAEAIRRLRAAGQRVAFLTNNSGPTVADHVASLKAAPAAASLLEPGQTAGVVGGQGVIEALSERQVGLVPLIPSEETRPDAV